MKLYPTLFFLLLLLLSAPRVCAVTEGPEEIAQASHKFQIFASQKAKAELRARAGKFYKIVETVYERDNAGFWVCSIAYIPLLLEETGEVEGVHTFRFLARNQAMGKIRKEHKKVFEVQALSYSKNEAGKWVCLIRYAY